jgi:hypothetical protein
MKELNPPDTARAPTRLARRADDPLPRWQRFTIEPDAAADSDPPDRRRSQRHAVSLRVDFSTIDPARDRRTGELYYDVGENEELLDLSVRGGCIRMDRAPGNGTRLTLRVRASGGGEPIDLIARTRWSRVDFVRGEHGARASALVGIEIIGGTPAALDHFERCVATAHARRSSSLARPEALG